MSANNQEEELSEMDDYEKNRYILSPEEIRIKSLIWNNMHKEWIEI